MGSKAITGTFNQYVIEYSSAPGKHRSITLILKDHPEVKVLKETRGGVTLVEMPVEARNRIAEAFPDLIIEPNIRYTKVVNH